MREPYLEVKLFGKPIKKIETIKLQAEMNRLLDEMDTIDTSSEEYTLLMTHLERINKLRTQERPQRVSRDTLALVLGNFGIALVIVAFEQRHVASSKAWGLIPKMRNP